MQVSSGFACRHLRRLFGQGLATKSHGSHFPVGVAGLAYRQAGICRTHWRSRAPVTTQRHRNHAGNRVRACCTIATLYTCSKRTTLSIPVRGRMLVGVPSPRRLCLPLTCEQPAVGHRLLQLL